MNITFTVYDSVRLPLAGDYFLLEHSNPNTSGIYRLNEIVKTPGGREVHATKYDDSTFNDK